MTDNTQSDPRSATSDPRRATSDSRSATSDARPLDFKEFRARVGDLRGREYWRSLEELSRSDEFDAFFEQEFPRQAAPLAAGVHRRDFLKLMGASVALGGLAACNYPAEKIIPYVRQPENLIPGRPIFFASAMPLGGYTTGVLVESHMYRPTKIEGNPDHGSSLGASDAFMQASVLGLYDPDRSQVVRHVGEIATWSDFLASLVPVLKAAGTPNGASTTPNGASTTPGAGLRLLTQTITSPTLGAQIQQVLSLYPGMKWHQWDAAGRDNVREGHRLAFGSYVDVHYDFTKANVIVSLDSDVLDCGPGHLRYAKDFASRRRVRKGAANAMNRVYAIESGPSGIGSMADHRLPVKPSQVESYARAIAASLGLGNAQTDHGDWIGALVRDLQKNHGSVLVVAGDQQPPAVHAIAMAINQALGSIGTTVLVTDSAEVAPVNQLASLKELVTDMAAGNVKALIMLGGNPVFDAPADLQFAHALVKVPWRAHLSLDMNETSMLAHWHIPETHYLESWGDGRGHDGTVSIVQPLIAPLYNGRSAHELVGAMAGGMDVTAYDAVRNYWAAKSGAGAGFEQTWRKWLHDGLIAGSALPPRAAAASTALPPATQQPSNAATTYELQLRPDPTVHDGRFANNGWLQELPKPQTKITWDNVAIVSAKTFRDVTGFADDKRDAWINEKRTVLADLTFNGDTIRVPLWVLPGQPDGVITLSFGYGRRHGGKIAVSNGDEPYGVNVYPIRKSSALHGGLGAELKNSGLEYDVACTQEHQSLNPADLNGMERGIIRSASFEEYQKNPSFAHEREAEEPNSESMYPKYEYKGHAWAMVIDTSVCTGCNGCVVACVSENNISIVGKAQVHAEREMHWLRIDRYYKGPADNPEVYHQPVPCMQCEAAPCEPVCPVGATSHSGEGLNDMTYNRCVGTRYCSNNCPYKVRRFNFYHYADYDTPALKPMRNPDVTVRTRGVMEKCTYCVQRVNAAKIDAEKENRRVRDGEVTTACAQACPTDAIVFGDMNDPSSHVAQLKGEPTNYALLGELNTRPRTTYLANVRNPNPEIKS